MIDLIGRRVLIVEDEAIIAMTLEDVLQELGCFVVGPAAGIADALASIRTEAIDAAFLDLNIDGRESYLVADALRARDVPFLFCTGYGADGVDPRYAGSAVLQKPFMPSEVEIGLRRILACSAEPR
jgi:CheY-like chemotaxis protein